jgi:hypothetical protein
MGIDQDVGVDEYSIGHGVLRATSLCCLSFQG